ncbi:hypothetical protein ID866_4055 [Astraeus odoratus]|nr:hypothetical protein ID866_4055 [Astraeus odoratus]
MMSSQGHHPISPPPVPASPPSTGVRRHHTISSSSRTARAHARGTISEETQEQHLWNDDEPVDEDWVGGVGAQDLSDANAAQHQQVVEVQSQSSAGNPSPLSPQFATGSVPSPPPGGGVRRHQSLTYGAQGGVKQMAGGLKRAGTLQANNRHPSGVGQTSTPAPEEECKEEVELVNPYEDESYFLPRSPPPAQQPHGASGQGQYPTTPMGRSSPWNSQGTGDWRTPGALFSSMSSTNIDDVTRALSTMELNSNQTYSSVPYQSSPSSQPPRFNPATTLSPGMRSNYMQTGSGNSRKLQLNTELDGRKTPTGQPATMSRGSVVEGDRAFNSTGPTTWDQTERLLGQPASNPNLNYGYSNNQGQKSNVPNVPLVPTQYLNQVGNVQAPRLGANFAQGPLPQSQTDGAQTLAGLLSSPVDIPTLITTKGYNPPTFDTRPPFARYFVIKSYTEDDVHKSLKYEIWSSTDPGNKRLDKAFKECAGRGPIYLFFSVNASGHFCGMAEMLTPVDYTRSSTVWASDKWKGVFKVRWIFVRDIPNASLRHIRLNNTAERKPVTNSRDTQELLPEAGQEMLRIFYTHPARTSLLQDFAFYELQSMQKTQAQQQAAASASTSGTSTPQSQSPPPQQQAMFTMPNLPNAALYNAMSPGIGGAMTSSMLQMQMQMGMLNPFMPQTQAMHQSVMRHSSPGPTNNQNFMNMGGVPY